MGEHFSLVSLLHKLVRIFSFLLLWQFGCGGFRARVTAGMPFSNYPTTGVMPVPGEGYVPCGPGTAYRHCVPGPPNCPPNQGLPCEEAAGLQNVLDYLGSETSGIFNRIARSFCKDRNTSYITCNCTSTFDNCHISQISMVSLGLQGFIHGDVSKLTYLESLDLSGNKLHDTIPDSLGNLSHLNTMDLSSNQLSGSIPESLGNLGSLTSLSLYKNFLTGRIPRSLGNLLSLQYLSLRFNKLEGEIPNELGKLSKLTYLKLDENRLCGQLPPGLGKLRNLEILWLTSNNFTGELPPAYSELKSLEQFEIGGNNLNGTIPDYIHTHWVNLTDLNLLGNKFSDVLPPGIFSMSNLEYLWVSDLQNDGFQFPTTANLENIYSMILRKCSISGQIPSYIGNWTSLRYLDLSFNKLENGIPDSFKDHYFSYMSFTGNMLSGKVPDWINDNVYKADLSYNNFENATFPKADLAYNNSTNVTFEASTPVIISPNRTSIRNMSVEYCKDGKSKYHSLFINSGGEALPIGDKQYEADNETSYFYASPRRNWAYTCSGDFLSSNYNSSDYIQSIKCGVSEFEAPLYEKSRLCPISLTYYGFCLHEGRYTVSLHFAEPVYTEDDDYSSLGQRVFDVYVQGDRKLKDFNLTEKVAGPNKAWVENITTEVKKNDSNMLTIHFFWAGKGSIYNPPQLNGPLISAIAVTPNFKTHRKLSTWQIVAITVGSVFALLLLLALLWRMGFLGNKELYEKKIEIRGKYYSLKQLMDATRNFSPRMEIGKGHFGTMYKAELPDQTVAVKKLSALSKQVVDQIGTEVYALRSLKHENLVELLSSYSRKGMHFVIYEYMEHNSLKEALFDSQSSGVLPWEVRYNICLGVAEGLKYLHERTPRVIHRNIKATNVLLDDTFKAKISDFGLAKLYEEENPYLVIGVEASLVYMAPEYATRRAISDKVDVYSFGIVVLEIVSGRNNAEYNNNQETVFLVDAACVSQTKGRLLDLVDRKLSNYNRGQAITVLNLAMMCIDQSPTLRPMMSEVVDVLEGNKTIEQISKVSTPSE